jgi:crotonobetainyl-CoA:carnitine CoA-transferase CaiB-like acyl-CoA transferase
VDSVGEVLHDPLAQEASAFVDVPGPEGSIQGMAWIM